MDTIDTPYLKKRHPHIAKKVETLWGSKECRDYIMHILKDSRDGKRAGFDFSVAGELLKLIAKHDELFPQFNVIEPAVQGFRFHTPPPIAQQEGDWSVVRRVAFVIIGVLLLPLILKVPGFITSLF